MAEQLPKTELLFDRVVGLENPNSTSHGHMRGRLAQLKAEYGVNFVSLQTKPDNKATEEMLQEELEDGDVLCVAGGDGTLGTVVSTLVNIEVAHLRIPLLPLGGGNGNDLASMLNSKKMRKSPKSILSGGHVVPIHAISANLLHEDELTKKVAAAHAGFGATADGADALNQAEYRNRPFYENTLVRSAYEARVLARTLLHCEKFMIQEDDSTEPQIVYDISIVNGPRMAKWGRPPIHLTDPALYMIATTKKPKPLGLLTTFGKLALGRPDGTYIDEDNYGFTTLDPVLGHFDGEAQIIVANTHVTLGQTEQPFYAVTTNEIV